MNFYVNLCIFLFYAKDALTVPLSEEQAEIQSIISEHVLNQANIPTSFRMESPASPFIGRISELSEIKWAHVDRKIVVLTGPRGVGKSELAKKYAQDFKLDNVSSTIWINSENHLSVKDAFRDLAITVGLSTVNKGTSTIVRDVLGHFGSRKTLLIFDNANPSNLFIANLENWIGDSKLISVLVTSRDENWDQNKYRIIPIKPFTLEETTQYIKTAVAKEISLTVDDGSCKQLGDLLKFNPLALRDAVREIVRQNSLNPSSVYTILDFINSFNPASPSPPIEIRPPTDDELDDAIQHKINREWVNVRDSIADEAKRFGDNVADEAKRFGDNVASEAKNLGREIKSWFG